MRLSLALSLTRRYLTDDLLKPKFKNKKRLSKTAGHCYVASEALYYLLSPAQKNKYKPHYLKINGITHWFLMSEKKDNLIDILDPTYDQFKKLPDYSKGKRASFLTKTPSKRTLILLQRILIYGSYDYSKNT